MGELEMPKILFFHSSLRFLVLFFLLFSQFKVHAADEAQWKAKYQEALKNEYKNVAISCQHYKDLSKESNFPLKTLALVKSHRTCENDSNLPLLPELRDLKPYELVFADLLEVQKKEDYEIIKKPISSLDYLKNGWNYKNLREFKLSHKSFSKVLNNKQATYEQINSAYKGIRQNYKLQGNKYLYLKTTRNWYLWTFKNKDNFKKTNSFFFEAISNYAKASWTEGNSKESLRILAREPLFKDMTPAQKNELNFIQAKIFEEKKQLNLALIYLNKIQKNTPENYKDPKFTKYLWNQAWILRKSNQGKGAIEVLTKLSKVTEDPVEKNKYQFWLGKLLIENQQKEAGVALLKKLQNEDLFGFYGLLVSRELKTPLPKLPENSLVADNNWEFTPIVFDESESLIEVADNNSIEGDFGLESLETANREPASIRPHQSSKEEIDFLNWLLRVGELSYAQKLLLSKVSSKRPSISEKELTILIRGAESGVYFPLFSKFNILDPEKKKSFYQDKLSLIFPRPYLKEVKQWSLSSSVEPEFMYSIMRQESAFNPRARSGADAFGLLQIIPDLADKYHDDVISEFEFHPKNLKAKKFLRKAAHEKLLDPDFNIAVGSRVIRSLKDRYQGKFIPMVCAYNASEKALNNWLGNWKKSYSHKDILDFIEEVPYEETRIYIKLTMRNYLFYKRFAQPKESIPFPEELLQL
jgi:soluble lytic murein transglycosylase